jgi:hypothetical protein
MSVVSNTCLILLKAVAGSITGSVAILTEAVLILVGSAAIAFQAIRRLAGHGHVQRLGIGIAPGASDPPLGAGGSPNGGFLALAIGLAPP